MSAADDDLAMIVGQLRQLTQQRGDATAWAQVADELLKLRKCVTKLKNDLAAANARIEGLEAALHTATELLRGISEENLAMSTPSLVAADAFLAALDEEGEK